MKTKFSKYSLIAFAAGALGFISTFAQLFLVREFLVVFYGNELVIGIILFSWIFLSGVGSYVAISLEKCKSRIELVYGGFMALAFFQSMDSIPSEPCLTKPINFAAMESLTQFVNSLYSLLVISVASIQKPLIETCLFLAV